MSNPTPPKDPMELIKSMWSTMGLNLPAMVTPTLDVKELDKRIADLRAVEGWLKMNLSMLQMSIQGMEMQRTTLAAVQSFGQSATGHGDSSSAFANAAMWPWNLMQQAAESASSAAATASAPAAEAPPASGSGPAAEPKSKHK